MAKIKSGFEYTLPEAGEHIGRISDVRFKQADKGAKAYYEIEMDCGNEALSFRLYASRVPYFMGCIARQIDKDVIGGMSLQKVLECLMEQVFSVWVVYDEEYGVQYQFSAPRVGP